MQTHNPHLDTTRRIVAATPHPTPISQHELDLAAIAVRNALWNLREAFRLLNPDNALRIQAETAGSCAKRLSLALQARGAGEAH